ncbi:MAG: hypothetical protein CMF49_02580 [Legionellales bacterium]|nr:hypothetical protein [Legionellales bacterium]|tara:strand:- start:32 stop:511 length:480 start_codon:yes stop_codon:yes gene_type:complete
MNKTKIIKNLPNNIPSEIISLIKSVTNILESKPLEVDYNYTPTINEIIELQKTITQKQLHPQKNPFEIYWLFTQSRKNSTWSLSRVSLLLTNFNNTELDHSLNLRDLIYYMLDFLSKHNDVSEPKHIALMISNLRKLVEKQDEKLGKDRKWLDTCCILP